MINKVIFLILFCSITTAYGQISFEKGYLIDNENHKIECFIKNYEWEGNPVECEYKLVENGDIKKGDITSIKEFIIYGSSKYIRANTRIERSPAELSGLRNPTWNQEQLFLKVLVQGKASLYNYTEKNSNLFFYSVSDTLIQQLVCRKYLTDNNQIAVNNNFRQQLKNDVNCGNTANALKSIAYSEGELERHFKKFNDCIGETFTVYNHKINKGKFNLRITPGIDYASLSMFTFSNYTKYRNVDFDPQMSFRLGLEAEYILPFYKNKFGIIFEPTYQHFNAQKVIGSRKREAKINYNSIELAAGIRYFILLNDNTKVFINGLVNSVASFNINSKLDLPNDLDSTIWTLKMQEKSNFALGCGLNHKRLSIEFRYYSPQKIMNFSQEWTSKYQKYSFIVGYNLLKTRQNKK